MKKWIISILLVSAFGLMAYAKEQSQETCDLYSCHDQEHKITIQSDKGVVSVIDAPKGSWVGISGTMTSKMGEKVITFKGDVIVRLRRADEVEKSEGNILADIMSKAPFELHLKNTAVSMEPVE